MATLTTLSTTTFAADVSEIDAQVKLTSTAGIVPGLRLYADAELMTVLAIGIGTWVKVLRGSGGTGTSRHAAGATVTLGRADQFYSQDPVGTPPPEVLVSPWINVLTGVQWTAQGDGAGSEVTRRWWQATVTTHSTGSLGVRTTTQTP